MIRRTYPLRPLPRGATLYLQRRVVAQRLAFRDTRPPRPK
jgi:hypothetical protein